MDRDTIIKQLKEAHIQFSSYINTLTEEKYQLSIENKWNAGQHVEHILKSVKMLNKALKIPKWLLKLKFGHANRSSKTYDKLVEKYQDRITNAKATPRGFQPNKVTFNDKKQMLTDMEKTLNSLVKKLNKLTEKELDYYILPHPLLGKQTFREQFYFAIYHVELHQSFVERDLLNHKKQ